MNNLAKLISSGTITVEELANALELIEHAKKAEEAVKACKKTISFPIGVKEIDCYSFMDSAGEYCSWGTCDSEGIFTCYCNWGGDHVIGKVNLTNAKEIFLAYENNDFACDLDRFLSQQIAKAKAT